MIYPLSKLVKIMYGKNQKEVLDVNGKYPIYGTGGLIAYSNKYLYDKPSVLIGRKGTINKVKYVEKPFWTVDTLFYTIINEEYVLPKYLYYKMLTLNLDYYNEGTTIPSLRKETLYRIELDIPSIITQKKCIKILGDIDKKIKLNEEINNNLFNLIKNNYLKMQENMSEFEKYARKHCGVSSLKLHDFQSVSAAYVSPTIIEERQLNVATMDVFSRLMMDRIIFLGAPIYDDAANIIQAQLLFLESVDPEKDIQIYINSPGGSVSAGLGIYDTMQLVAPDVATICTGLAASMGAVLLTAGAKGKRAALPHSRVMIHQPLGGAQGQASDIEITAREIMKTKRELYEILSAHSGVSVRKIEKDADRDYWLSAREAKEYGLIDEVLSKREK